MIDLYCPCLGERQNKKAKSLRTSTTLWAVKELKLKNKHPARSLGQENNPRNLLIKNDSHMSKVIAPDTVIQRTFYIDVAHLLFGHSRVLLQMSYYFSTCSSSTASHMVTESSGEVANLLRMLSIT